MSETIHVTLDEDVLQRIRAKSQAWGLSEEQLIQQALAMCFGESSFQDLRARVIPQAQAAGFFTDEDVFREIS